MIRTLMALAVPVACTGCMRHELHPYRGTKTNLMYVASGGALPHGRSDALMAVLFILDTPLSFVGDTLVLPYSTWTYVDRRKRSNEAPKTGP
jgi:uncharacterized protein YceK